MKKAILAAGALSLALAGCQSSGNGLNTPSVNVASLIQDAQIAAELACSVAPTALTITAILTANPAVGTANQIASLVCAKVGATNAPKASRNVAAARKGVRDYGTIIVKGHSVHVEGTPVQ